MSRRNMTTGMQGGQRGQSAVPQRRGRARHALRANGLTLRGVVTATYETDQTPFIPALIPNLVQVFCDVFIYSPVEGIRAASLLRVPVIQNAGMHDGRVWKPRAAKITFGGGKVDSRLLDPQTVDGDHVLVEFLEDDTSRPFIRQRWTHPQMGLGDDSRGAGHRLKLKLIDGSPSFEKNHGSYFGVDDNGDFIIDTTRAHGGQFDGDGNEVPSNDTTHGAVRIRVNAKNPFNVVGVDPDGAGPLFEIEGRDNGFEIKLHDGATLALAGNGASATMTVGDGSQSATIFEAMKTYVDAQLVLIRAHTHPDGWGSTAPSPALAAIVDVPSVVGSTKVKIPPG